MVKAKLYNQTGEQQGEIELNPAIFEIKPKKSLVHQAVIALLANRRHAIAHTKTRGEIRGGGKKPWKQKGTGRARAGSTRSPLWVGGGIIFGPRNIRNFSLRINKKMKTKALLMALSDKVNEQALSVIDKLEMSNFKTKTMVDLLKKINFTKGTLLVVDKADKKITSSVRNIVKTELVAANSLNVYDVMRFKNILFTESALAKVEQVYLKKK
mgnify:FL=1